MGNSLWLWSTCRGIWTHLELICRTWNHFVLLRWHQLHSRLLKVFLGTLGSSIQEVQTPFMFDGEDGIALHAMQWNRASCGSAGIVSLFFSSCGGNLGYTLVVGRGWPFKTCVHSAMSGLMSSYQEHIGNLLESWQGNRDASLVETWDPGSLSMCHRDIRIPINFQ